MSAKDAFTDLVTTIGALAGTPATKQALDEALAASGMRLNRDQRPIGMVTDAQLQKFVAAVSTRVVWKLAARRVLRSHGIT